MRIAPTIAGLALVLAVLSAAAFGGVAVHELIVSTHHRGVSGGTDYSNVLGSGTDYSNVLGSGASSDADDVDGQAEHPSAKVAAVGAGAGAILATGVALLAFGLLRAGAARRSEA